MKTKWKLRRVSRRGAPDRSTRAAMRQKLQQAGYLPDRSSWAYARTIAVVSTVVMLSIAGATSTYAYVSDDVLPDHPLYSVRQGIEHAQIALAVTADAKARVHEEQLTRRLKEVADMQKQKRVIPAKRAQVFLAVLDEAVVGTSTASLQTRATMSLEEAQELRQTLRERLKEESRAAAERAREQKREKKEAERAQKEGLREKKKEDHVRATSTVMGDARVDVSVRSMRATSSAERVTSGSLLVPDVEHRESRDERRGPRRQLRQRITELLRAPRERAVTSTRE